MTQNRSDTLRNVAEYKINTKISNFMHSNNDQVEKEIRKPIPVTIAPPPKNA
jgi:hypothetical protein